MDVERYGSSAYYRLGPVRVALSRGTVGRPGFDVGWYRPDGKLDWNFSLYGAGRAPAKRT